MFPIISSLCTEGFLKDLDSFSSLDDQGNVGDLKACCHHNGSSIHPAFVLHWFLNLTWDYPITVKNTGLLH